ncbi:MAG: intradiol ring-cleavage dioxygenase [Nocardioides sp.]|uniref:intradiol ring-cleavage dioxygenase n=1 Tax=Nocardioides sp. TaxID=35761 RepID=UPI0039E6064F
MSWTTRRTIIRSTSLAALAVGATAGVRELIGSATAAVPTSSSATALATSTGCATLSSEMTEGPFWVDEQLNRSDITADSEDATDVQEGVPLTLTINLTDASADCTPQPDMYVDIWHANAQGVYSDVSGSGNPDETGVDWLRGYQVSDEDGSVTFTTIWPGWYVSRTIHIHVRIRTSLDEDTAINFTTQLFFDDDINDEVIATSDYQKSSSRDTTNDTDSLYDAAMVVPVSGSTTDGYTGVFTINLDFDDGEPSGTASASASASSTATSTPTAGATATTTASADTVVRAHVIAAHVIRRGGRRVVVVRSHNNEKVTAKVRLVRSDNVLAHRRWGWLSRGTHRLAFAVPRRIKAGKAKVSVIYADRAGNAKVVRVPVHLPHR